MADYQRPEPTGLSKILLWMHNKTKGAPKPPAQPPVPPRPVFDPKYEINQLDRAAIDAKQRKLFNDHQDLANNGGKDPVTGQPLVVHPNFESWWQAERERAVIQQQKEWDAKYGPKLKDADPLAQQPVQN